MPNSISIVGAGNTATNLALALKKASVPIRTIVSRTIGSANELANKVGAKATTDIAEIDFMDPIILIAVKDDEIGSVANQLKAYEGIVAHCSGSVSIDALKNCKYYGVLYPFVSMKKEIQTDFTTVDFFIEGNTKEIELELFQLAQRLSKQVHVIDSKQRASLHLAAVFANNFVNYQLIIAQQILGSNGLNFSLLRPLLKKYFENIVFQNPSELQTGPAIREDKAVIKKHIDMLENNDNFKSVYELLTKQIQALKQG